MILNLIAFMMCAIVCIYTGLRGEATESIICFIMAAVNLMCILFDMFMGGRPA